MKDDDMQVSNDDTCIFNFKATFNDKCCLE